MREKKTQLTAHLQKVQTFKRMFANLRPGECEELNEATNFWFVVATD